MPKFAANLSMMYPELDFLDRFEAAAKDGFQAVEYLFPYAYESRELAARLKAHGLQQVLFNAPPGDWENGERGLACLPGREAEFRAGIDKTGDQPPAPPETTVSVRPLDVSSPESPPRIDAALRRGRLLGESSTLARALAHEPG